MNEILQRSWWVPAARGGVALAFGLVALLWPSITLLAFVMLFAAFALLGGMVSLAGAVRHRRTDNDWWLLLLIGLAGVGASAIAILHPSLTVLILLLLIGAYALVTGVLDIVAAVRLKRDIANEWLMVASGAVSVLFGILMFLFPGAGGLVLLWMIAAYAIVTGALMLGLAFRLRVAALDVRTRIVDQRVTPDRRGVIPDRRGLVAHS